MFDFKVKNVQFREHCATACKITAPMDTICGNESKNRKTGKNRPFFTSEQVFFQKYSGLILRIQ
jgi:hypothetical protein